MKLFNKLFSRSNKKTEEQIFIDECFSSFQTLFNKKTLPTIEQAISDYKKKEYSCTLFTFRYFDGNVLVFENNLISKEITTDNVMALEKCIVDKMLEYMDKVRIKFPMLKFVETYETTRGKVDHFLYFSRKK